MHPTVARGRRAVICVSPENVLKRDNRGSVVGYIPILRTDSIKINALVSTLENVATSTMQWVGIIVVQAVQDPMALLVAA